MSLCSGIVHHPNKTRTKTINLRKPIAMERNAHATFRTNGLHDKRALHSVDTRFLRCDDDRQPRPSETLEFDRFTASRAPTQHKVRTLIHQRAFKEPVETS
jgi:hypothetical protein